MDVRCENCQTEYELDGSRLKPGGVTVKCTACGHMFKVRKRTASVDPGEARVPRSSSPAAGDEERPWLIRLEDGEIKTCRELATLQHWIVAREVSRAAEISRTGKKWKKLGEITELEEFFEVAEEARRRRTSAPVAADEDDDLNATLEWQGRDKGPRRAPTAHPRLVPSRGSGPHRAHPSRASSVPPPLPSEASRPVRRRSQAPEQPESDPVPPKQPMGPGDTVRGIGVSGPPQARAAPSQPGVEPPAAGPAEEASEPAATGAESAPEQPPREARRPSSSAPIADREAEEAAMARLRAANGQTGQSASPDEPRRFRLEDEGPSGPTGGLARGVPTDDVAFAGRGFRAPPGGGAGGPPSGSGASVSGTHIKRGGGAAPWILGASLLVLAAAVAVIYIFVFRTSGAGTAAADLDAEPQSADAAVALADADAGALASDPELLAAANEAVLAGVQDALAEAAESLEGADDDLDSVVARSRVHAAWAQILLDLGALEGGSEGRALRQEAGERASEARKWASRARELDREAVGALVATGDALRVSGRRARDVRRPLRRAFAESSDDVDAQLALALVLVEEGRARQAARNLEELTERAEASDPADPRPRLQLALLELERDDDEAAREHVEKVLALAPDHEVARALADILEDRGAVVAEDDPMPREEDPADEAQPVSYDGLLDRANELAERGRCGEAMRLFRRALEVDASGVDALTGLAYCHLDAREFASAHARFQAALSASPRYQPALYGIAEAYQQQGLSDRAIEAYERYLELHPNGTRAEMAKRQIARLGGQPEPDQGGRDGAGDDDDSDDTGSEGEEGAASGEGDGGDGEGGEDDEPQPFLSDE